MADLAELEEKIGYKFGKREYLRRAMTHSSYSGGKNNGSNERLEFLGDSVLQITVSQYLFTNMTTVPEGGLTKLRASIVCENSLYNFANRIELGKYILLGKGEEMTGGRTRRSILADAFEAMIAAVYLDGGMDAAMAMITAVVWLLRTGSPAAAAARNSSQPVTKPSRPAYQLSLWNSSRK